MNLVEQPLTKEDKSEKPSEELCDNPVDINKPSTSKLISKDTNKSEKQDVICDKKSLEEENAKQKPQQSESDSETQNTSCSEDSIINDETTKTSTIFENLKKLETTVNELIAIIERKG